MSFRCVYKRAGGSGSGEQLVQELAKSAITVGRGADSDVILEGARISPSHARFNWDGAVLQVQDLGALAGVRVNNRRVNSAPIKDRDIVTIGDIDITIAIKGECVELVFEATERDIVGLDERVASALRVFQLESRLPSMRVILLTLAVITLLACGVYPLASKRFVLWNSGPISNAHSLIASDCTKCHAEPFNKVQDRECLSCHQMSEHSPSITTFATQHSHLQLRCATCHMEHNGDYGLRLKDAEFCTSCHASLPTLKSDSKLLAVSHFSDHPQFRVAVVQPQGEKARVSLDDRANLVDGAQIKLNHAVHLKSALRGPNGPTTLSCQSCHQLDSDLKRMRPISFDSHCRDCHNLGFDERLPDVQVPHGDAEAVYPALFTEYAKLLMPGAKGPATVDAPARRFPSGAESQGLTTPMSLGGVEQSAREAETQLFTKTGCFLCHTYSAKDPTERTPSNSHYRIAPPQIPSVWLPAARFSHGAHEEFSCQSCHGGVHKSTETKDVLLPGIQSCRDCHAQGAGPGYVESGCGECHSYHAAIGFPNEKKHTIAEYLRELTR